MWSKTCWLVLSLLWPLVRARSVELLVCELWIRQDRVSAVGHLVVVLAAAYLALHWLDCTRAFSRYRCHCVCVECELSLVVLVDKKRLL
jgi:hypothetical protein